MLFALLFTLGVWTTREASSSPPPETHADEAKKEEKLVFYTTMDLPQNINVISHFLQKYPYWDLELHPLDSPTLIERIQSEARNGVAGWDVLLGGGGVFRALFQANLIAPYRSPEREGVSGVFNDKHGLWSGYYVNAYVLGYNTSALRQNETPKSYDDLLNGRWKGNRIALDRNAHGMLRALAAVWGREKALAYLKQLAGQRPVMAPDNIVAVDSLHTGTVAIAIARVPLIHAYKAKLKSSIDWNFLGPVVGQIDAVMLSARSRNPVGARLFVDFLQSREGQEEFAEIQQFPVRRDMKPGSGIIADGHPLFIERPDKNQNYSETVNLFRDIFGLR